MKRLYILMLALLCLAMMTCRKDVEPYVFNAEIKVSDIRAKQVLVEAINDEEGFEKLSAIVYCSTDEKLDEPKQYEMFYEDDRFKAYLTDLKQDTRYYYKVVFHGKYNSVEIEIDTFETQAIVLPTVTTSDVTDITSNSATCGGEVTSDGNGTVTTRGICWSTSQNPTIENNKITNGSVTESFTVKILNLVPNTQYYVRAYATNEKGTSYGDERSFETSEVKLPEVKTNNVSDITSNSATCGGNVISDGNGTVTARGICWSISQNPTIEDNKTTEGYGLGSFTSNLSNLVSQTTYYVRAYATNEAGTVYGEQKTFTTQKKAVSLPDVLKTTVSNVTSNTAVFGSSVFSDGGGIVSARGFCWSSTTETPTITNSSYTTNGSGLGSFSADVTGLKASTQYYVRAYAANEAGTTYSEMVSFYTCVEEQPEDEYEQPSDNNGHSWVDLGLPSGLKWATCNVGATSPEGYGNYFAWGETTTKETYIEENSTTYGLTYSSLQSQGYIDSEGNLTPQYDAATANWGGDWRMPTYDELNELITNCTWTWTIQNGVNGYKVEGPNGNSIFLPAAGHRYGSSLYDAGSDGRYWSSTPYGSYDNYGAYNLYFDSSYHYMNSYYRSYGLSVRPILE